MLFFSPALYLSPPYLDEILLPHAPTRPPARIRKATVNVKTGYLEINLRATSLMLLYVQVDGNKQRAQLRNGRWNLDGDAGLVSVV